MATDKKKEVKMKDLKPNKDAKGGMAKLANTSGISLNKGSAQANKGGSVVANKGGSLLS